MAGTRTVEGPTTIEEPATVDPSTVAEGATTTGSVTTVGAPTVVDWPTSAERPRVARMSETDVLDRRATTPTVVVVCGLPGVGKTTVAENVAERVDGRLVRTDVVRKDLFSEPEYTAEESRQVYAELFDRARETVDDGRSVVLDGTFKNTDLRDRALELSESLDAGFRLVKVECAEDVVRERIREREGDASDADYAVHEMYRDRFEPVRTDHVTVDNSDGIEETTRQVSEQF